MIPNIDAFIVPITDVAFKKHETLDNINLNKVTSSSSDFWYSVVVGNTQISEIHTENDCTYTLICVPKQEYLFQRNKQMKHHFVFKVKDKENASIRFANMRIQYPYFEFS